MGNLSRRQVLIGAGLVLLVIILLLALIDIGAVIDMLLLADWRFILLGTFFLLLGYGIVSLRTRYLLENKTGFLETIKVDSSGFMLSILAQIPNSIYRAVAINKTTDTEGSLSTAMVVSEYTMAFILRIVVLIFGVALFASRIRGAENTLLVSLVIVAILLVILFVMLRYKEQLQPKLASALRRLPRISGERAESISNSFYGVLAGVGSPRRFLTALLLTLVFWICFFLFFEFILLAFDLDESISYPIVALVTIFIVPPSAPMMVGIYHGLLIAPLVALDIMDAELAMAYAVLVHAIQMVLLIVLGVWGLSRMNIR
ncbi:lysylphosphatidylglycerol synthase transmembrane domain-containing protein, partial [Chloroflexota bacterium]